MTKPIPKNLQARVSLLYQKYGYHKFSFEDAQDLLKVDRTYLGKIMSELCNTGWVNKVRDEEDNRVKIYSINIFDNTIVMMETSIKDRTKK